MISCAVHLENLQILPRYCCTSELTGQVRTALINLEAERPLITLMEMQRSSAQVEDSINSTTSSGAGLYGGIIARDGQKKRYLELATSHVGSAANM